MLPEYDPVLQALFGTLFTWALTAAGSALVFVFSSGKRRILDGSLGFAAGVMLAASYWSLLAPAIEMATVSGKYGHEGKHAYIPVGIGFALGALFVYAADVLLPILGNPIATIADNPKTEDLVMDDYPYRGNGATDEETGHTTVVQRRKGEEISLIKLPEEQTPLIATPDRAKSVSWKRMLLLIVAITVHNIPEGLAVGVGFGAIGKTSSATFENARNLALGIGIQNFPEGLAVSLPLRGAGMGVWKSFWWVLVGKCLIMWACPWTTHSSVRAEVIVSRVMMKNRRAGREVISNLHRTQLAPHCFTSTYL